MEKNTKLYGIGGLRQSQRQVLPGSIKNAQLASDIIKNTAAVEEDPFATANGAQLNVTSTVIATVADNLIIGTMPFMISYFQDSLTAANHIPFGGNVDNDLYTVYQTAVPQITSIGHDGFNIVYMSCCYNNTGSSQDIIVVTQARFLLGLGGSIS